MFTSIDSGRVINLKVVAKLKRGDKLNTRLYRFTIEETSIFSPAFFFRWVNGESRDQTIDALDTLISSCITQNGLSQRETMDLVDQLMMTSRGIKNLAETYKDDQTCVAGIEMILEKIEFFVKKYGKTIRDGSTDGTDGTCDVECQDLVLERSASVH